MTSTRLVLALALAPAVAAGGALLLPGCGGDPSTAVPQRPAGDPTPTAGATSVPATPARTATAPSNGFGDGIAWRGLEEGFREAASLGRPIMLVVHASWCSQCKALRPAFSDPALVALSDRFVMINVDQDLEPSSQQYGPDGRYVPRVLFFDPAGELDRELLNASRRRYKYYYSPHDDLVGAMRQALERHAKS
ncbi:Thioredoxin-like [Nannocystis exedens]|uniref:Thioredoxin-like n=1 Tax=Nannocystis exedens TaxID=54 RepID=A0A1I2AHY8_9BACT|nr:thioredoxin family protein [Nannocystis exedens]PCC69854.1 Thioredoxin [Nannocystis exedens]SFE43601.1 Thioredoxin-like [Nannocystis exedens]